MPATRMHHRVWLVLLTLATCPAKGAATEGDAAQGTPATETLTILSVDATTLPGLNNRKVATVPAWRTSFGSERRSEAERAKPQTAVDADIVMLQGVHDIRALRQWFPAREWRLVVSRQMLLRAEPSLAAEGTTRHPATAVAVRYRPGLRVTGQDHLLELADALGEGPSRPTAAATAVRVLIDGRETWAVSVLLPQECVTMADPQCPGQAALARWHSARAEEGVRRVTGGRFAMETGAEDRCALYGLRLDPAPPPPRPQFTPARSTPTLGCAADVIVTK